MKVTLKSMTTSNIVEYIAEFARVCTNRDNKKKDPTKDLELCKTLWKNGHHTPFESVNIDFLIEGVSRSLLAQITRYRHMTFNVESQRYCKYDKEIDFISPKGVSCGGFFDIVIEAYQELINKGHKPEDARCVLPNAMPTRFRVVMNLREFLHFYEQRSNKHAQQEIRTLADKMFKLLTPKNKPGWYDTAFFLNWIKGSFFRTLKDLIRELSDHKVKKDINNIISNYEEFV